MKRILILSLTMSALLMTTACQKEDEKRPASEEQASVPVDENGYPIGQAPSGGAAVGSPLQGTWVSIQCQFSNFFAPSNIPNINARQRMTISMNGGRVGELFITVDNFLDPLCSQGSFAGNAKRLIGSYTIKNALADHSYILTFNVERCEGNGCFPNDPFMSQYKSMTLLARPLLDGNTLQFGKASFGLCPPVFDIFTQYQRVAQ